jgi:hypothetical protein
MHDCRVHYSPYGTWKLTVVDHASLQLDTVTDVRFEFNLQYKPSLFGGDPVFFEGDMGCMIELGVAACATDGAFVPAPAGPPAPPTDPSKGHVPSRSVDVASCSSTDEFAAVFAPVNTECCDEPAEDCSTGFPATCAAVLLPAQTACAEFMTAGGLAMAATKQLVDRAAALCPGSGSGH